MRTNRNIIGRMCVVRDCKERNTLVEAMVIDQVAGSAKSKRVRLQTGEHFGEVRMPGEYELLEFCEAGAAPVGLATACAEPMFA